MKTNRRVAKDTGPLHPHAFARAQGIHIWVSHLDPQLVADGLDSRRLWQEARRQLLLAGLPVMPPLKGRGQPLYPCLGILVHADRANVVPPAYIYSVEVFYVQKISLAGAPHRQVMRMTWCRESIGDVRSLGQNFDWSNLYHAVGVLVDSFIQEVLGEASPEGAAKTVN